MIPGKSTGCPNLASCAFCDCKPNASVHDSTFIISDMIPGFNYAVSCTYHKQNPLPEKKDKVSWKKEHTKQLMKLQKKRF